GDHAAGAESALATRLALHLGGDELDSRDPGRRPIVTRVPRVEPVDVGEKNEEVGLDQMGYEGGQVVVVADLDLLHRDRVVLVDDAQDAVAQEGEERVAGVEVASAVADVLLGEQDLGDLLPVGGEGLLVVPHERRLADGGRRLLLGDRAGASAQAQPGRARGDGAGGDEGDLDPARVEAGQVGDQRLDPGRRRAEPRLREEPRAHLGPDPPEGGAPARPEAAPVLCAGAAVVSMAASAWRRASRPCPVRAEIRSRGRRWRRASVSTRRSAVSLPGRSTLLATTSWARRPRGGVGARRLLCTARHSSRVSRRLWVSGARGGESARALWRWGA